MEEVYLATGTTGFLGRFVCRQSGLNNWKSCLMEILYLQKTDDMSCVIRFLAFMSKSKNDRMEVKRVAQTSADDAGHGERQDKFAGKRDGHVGYHEESFSAKIFDFSEIYIDF